MFRFSSVLMIALLVLTSACRNEESLHGESNETFYRTNLDNKGLKLAEQVEDTLRVAGVCSLPVFKGNYGGRYIDSNDDVFTHFMLIANVESRLGDALNGVGGAGMFGTNLSHFDNNVKRKNPQTGQVFECRTGMTDDQIRKDHVSNAKCAFALYLANQGFKDWGGDDGPWGSNRKMSSLSSKLVSQLSRQCEDPACRKSDIAWGGTPSDRSNIPGIHGNVLTVTLKDGCGASKVAVKLFSGHKVEESKEVSGEWVELLPAGSRRVNIDLVHLKRRNPNADYNFARIQLKRGNAVLATLPLQQLPYSQD